MNFIDTNKLETYIGKTIGYQQYHYHLQQVKKEGESVVVYTDKKPIVFHSQNQVDRFLQDITIIEQPAPAPPTTAINQVIGEDVLGEIKGMMIDNLRQLRDNKDYIPQANAMAKQVNALVALTNLEIKARKALNEGDL